MGRGGVGVGSRGRGDGGVGSWAGPQQQRRAARTSVGPARATYVVQPGRRTSGPVAGQGASRAAGGQRDSRGFARTWAPPPLAANIIASMDRAARFGARTLCEAAQATPERASGGTGRVAGGGAAGGLTGFSRVARRFPDPGQPIQQTRDPPTVLGTSPSARDAPTRDQHPRRSAQPAGGAPCGRSAPLSLHGDAPE